MWPQRSGYKVRVITRVDIIKYPSFGERGGNKICKLGEGRWQGSFCWTQSLQLSIVNPLHTMSAPEAYTIAQVPLTAHSFSPDRSGSVVAVLIRMN